MRSYHVIFLALVCVLICSQAALPSLALACPDADGDGVCDAEDNCPLVFNPDQADFDGDGIGDACDADDDNDGVSDAADVDPLNPSICHDVDADTCDDCAVGTDGLGPLGDADPTNDGPDFDLDGICDAGDADDDNDGIPDGEDPCPLDPSNLCAAGDTDGDGIPDTTDNCPTVHNPDQTDTDGDGLGDVCDPCPLDATNSCECPDTDGDGVCDEDDVDPTDPFVCRDLDADTCDDCFSGTADPMNDGPDFDGDGICDIGDPDDDNDGIPDPEDPCPFDPTNSCECPDTDGDGVCDEDDVDPTDPFVCRDLDADTCDDCSSGTADPMNDGPDFDLDGICDAGDADDDNDGIPDGEDPCPLDPSNLCAAGDTDGDGIPDTTDNCPTVHNPDQTDTDGDGLGDVCDPCPLDATNSCECPDTDGDGVCDEDDVDPTDPFVCRDLDADTCDDCFSGTADPMNDGPDFDLDGICDAGDADDDNDGIPDLEDPCPLDPDNLCGSGDVDGDGIPDGEDNCPLTYNPLQIDTDADGLGDVCDPCPHDPSDACPACADLPPLAESWWPGDGFETDLIGDNHPTATIGAPAYVPAHVGEGFAFSGQDGYVIAHSPGLDIRYFESISVAAWVRVDSVSTVDSSFVILDKRIGAPGSNEQGYSLHAHSMAADSARVRFRVADGSSGFALQVATRVFPVGEFHHVAAVLDRHSGILAIYLDGRPQEIDPGDVGDLSNDSDLYIGLPSHGDPTFGSPFDGVIDELHFYARALSWCEIAAIHDADEDGVCRDDLDHDGIVDHEDNCPRVANADQSNQDLDPAGDACDCSPSSYGTFRTPMDADCGLLFGADGTKAGIDWCPQHLDAGDETVYTLVRGMLGELPVGSGAAETCLLSALDWPDATDPAEPPSGDGYWYLWRAGNSCGVGSYGTDSAGVRRGGPVLDSCALSEETLCLETDGVWDPTSCGHWVCGVQPDCDAIVPGCICGADRNFEPGRGCRDDPECE